MIKNLIVLTIHLFTASINWFYFYYRIAIIPKDQLSFWSAVGSNIYLTSITHDTICVYYLFVLYYDIKYLISGKEIPLIRYPQSINNMFQYLLHFAFFVAFGFWIVYLQDPDMIFKWSDYEHLGPNFKYSQLFTHGGNYLLLLLEFTFRYHDTQMSTSRRVGMVLAFMLFYQTFSLIFTLQTGTYIYPFMKYWRIQFLIFVKLIFAVTISSHVLAFESCVLPYFSPRQIKNKIKEKIKKHQIKEKIQKKIKNF